MNFELQNQEMKLPSAQKSTSFRFYCGPTWGKMLCDNIMLSKTPSYWTMRDSPVGIEKVRSMLMSEGHMART